MDEGKLGGGGLGKYPGVKRSQKEECYISSQSDHISEHGLMSLGLTRQERDGKNGREEKG